ncbi:hypothetical protein [Methylobacterium marchantiae]|uniref:Uncharacterized protein n=1 Tax=Methylobacterium marchantiae TaxID=600331 RepID=A0ABW3WUY5_9HYPH|nr:hypothetical protein AIGOOFII_0384 [Methylobacterium marchantiae]
MPRLICMRFVHIDPRIHGADQVEEKYFLFGLKDLPEIVRVGTLDVASRAMLRCGKIGGIVHIAL